MGDGPQQNKKYGVRHEMHLVRLATPFNFRLKHPDASAARREASELSGAVADIKRWRTPPDV